MQRPLHLVDAPGYLMVSSLPLSFMISVVFVFVIIVVLFKVFYWYSALKLFSQKFISSSHSLI